ncbi:fasciclin domain-containing protein [Sphingomicrobium astaxanthinifaciens]|uniref:fasciclin domain-containing protein n=1 Tax=Sphingomicrobium astaxanthinifaciens TaxID=1227949 RepID=UPI001FCB1214|nr:fasciclin domain-containing protein [Sphingomicrobium astaxanthinifaciens]MCJ7421246.1 fasciclin domain-containing protein [Sphingomicrobium astaxanthinifaciens]
MQRLTLALLTTAALGLSACGDTDTTVEPDADTAMTADDMTMDDEGQTIVVLAQDNPQFSTLVSAITTAELGETLSGDGPYTVFAPDNAAFEKIDQATLEGLMTEEQREQLTNILTYHVVEGDLMASGLVQQIEDAGGSLELTTVGGGTLTASIVDGNVVLTDATGGTATVTQTDLDASNGTIHVIDTVLMPAG